MEDKRVGNIKKHQIVLVEREKLNVDGVLHVDSFDDREIVLETDLGGLIIRGEDLHINELNLEQANLMVTGYIQDLEYVGESLGKRSKGLLAKLLR